MSKRLLQQPMPLEPRKIAVATAGFCAFLNLYSVMEVNPELAKDHDLFVHFYSISDTFMGSFGGPFPDRFEPGRQQFSFPIDTGQALKTGLGQMAVGVWHPGAETRLNITDFKTGRALGNIVRLDGFLQIDP